MSADKINSGGPKVIDPRKPVVPGTTAPTPSAPKAKLAADSVNVAAPTAAKNALLKAYKKGDTDFLDGVVDDVRANPASAAGMTRQEFIENQLKDSGLVGVARARKAKVLGTVFDQADRDRSGKVDGAGEAQALASGKAREARVAQAIEGIGAQAAEQARAIAAAQAKGKSGNIVSRGFNAFTNIFHRNMSQMEDASKNAVRLFQSDLPRDLEHYHEMVVGAGEDPGKIEAANQFLKGALAKADEAGKKFDKAAKAFGAGNKFWSGLTADVGSGLLVLGGVALCITGFGAPIGAGMIAGGVVAGGAMNVGAHALLDNQYDFKREALANFAVGGISAGATVLTAGMGTGAAASITRMAVQQGTIGSMTGMAGSMASEGSNGWQAGWAGRVTRSTVIGGTVGTLLGAGSGAVAQKFISPTLSAGVAQAARTGLGSVSGATGAGLAGVVNEGLDGFKEGWMDRVVRQLLGGALSGAAYSMGPDLAGRNKAVVDFIASPNGQALGRLRENFGDFKKMGVNPELVEKGVGSVSRHTLKALETAINSKHGSIDKVGAANVDHLGSVFQGVLERAFAANGNKPLTQARVNELAMQTVLTDAWGKGVSAANLADFKTAKTNAGETAGEIFAHLKAQAKKAIEAPAGSDLEKLIHAKIDEGCLFPDIVKSDAYMAALATAKMAPDSPAAQKLAGQIAGNFLNASPNMLGIWVHGIPGFDQVRAVVLKDGGTHAQAQQMYETVLGHHMAGFIANGFAQGKLELNFKAMVGQGQLTAEAGTRLENLYTSATKLAGEWRPIIGRATMKGESLTPDQIVAYKAAAEPFRKAIAALPEHVQWQLTQDDVKQFTAGVQQAGAGAPQYNGQGLPKWFGIVIDMAKNPNLTNGGLIDGVASGPMAGYGLESLGRGTEANFLASARGPAQRMGLSFNETTHTFQSKHADSAVTSSLAARILADPQLRKTLQQSIVAGETPSRAPADVVNWFRSQKADPTVVMRLITAPEPVAPAPARPPAPKAAALPSQRLDRPVVHVEVEDTMQQKIFEAVKDNW